MHTKLSAGVSKGSLALDYGQVLRDHITSPLVKQDQAVANMAGGCQDMMPGDEEEVDDVDEDCDIIEEDESIKTKNVLEAAVKSESGSSKGKGKGTGANCFIWDTFIVNVQNSAFLFL